MGSVTDTFSVDIPVINISGYVAGDDTKTRQIAQEIHAACQSPGFFQITGHTVDASLRSELFTRLAEFFNLPSTIKQSLHRSQSQCSRGYEAVGEQKLEATFADQKEGFMVGPGFSTNSRFLQGPNQWPDEAVAPGFRDVITAYFDEALKLSKMMFRLMALSLELDEKYFDAFVGSRDSISMCRAHRYPSTTPQAAQASRGIGAHTDFGALTLLLQDNVGGLEVYNTALQSWHPVKPIENAYIVNIGDMMERWTNKKYTSTLHRVISPTSTRSRYSVSFFNEGLLDQTIECIPTCLRPGEQPLYEPIKAEDHLRARYGNSY